MRWPAALIAAVGAACGGGLGPASPFDECYTSHLAGIQIASAPAHVEKQIRLQPGQVAVVEVTLGQPRVLEDCGPATPYERFQQLHWSLREEVVSLRVESCPCQVQRQAVEDGTSHTTVWWAGPGPVRFVVTALKPGRATLGLNAFVATVPCSAAAGPAGCGPSAYDGLGFEVVEPEA